MREAKKVKDDIATLEDRLDEERRRQVELRAIKDKLAHAQFKNSGEVNEFKEKEIELQKRL